jgi:hypothetical protein
MDPLLLSHMHVTLRLSGPVDNRHSNQAHGRVEEGDSEVDMRCSRVALVR